GRRGERTGRRHGGGVAVLRKLRRELADRRRLAGAVHTDDENHRRLAVDVQRRGLAEERRNFVRKRLTEVAELTARLEPAHELRGCRNPDVRLDQRLLE